MLENLLTISQYAALYRYNVSTIKSWVQRGQIPTVSIAGRTFISKAARPSHDVRVTPERQRT